MISDCPHCHTRVLTGSDGSCPACGRLVQDPDGACPDLTTVTLDGATDLPDACCLCGDPAGRRIAVARRPPRRLGRWILWAAAAAGGLASILITLDRYNDNAGIGMAIILLFMGPFLLVIVFILLLTRKGAGSSEEHECPLCLWLPVCDPCARKGRPRPVSVDLRQGRMTFVVHRVFAEQMGARRRTSGPADSSAPKG